jgi:hypothetical protein
VARSWCSNFIAEVESNLALCLLEENIGAVDLVWALSLGSS